MARIIAVIIVIGIAIAIYCRTHHHRSNTPEPNIAEAANTAERTMWPMDIPGPLMLLKLYQ